MVRELVSVSHQFVSIVVTGCCVLVCRFGGILLHADRFKHINNVARILLQESGLGQKVECLFWDLVLGRRNTLCRSIGGGQ